jgi:hypothetical protein
MSVDIESKLYNFAYETCGEGVFAGYFEPVAAEGQDD